MASRAQTNALPPALIIVQNCCRPSEGIFDPAWGLEGSEHEVFRWFELRRSARKPSVETGAQISEGSLELRHTSAVAAGRL